MGASEPPPLTLGRRGQARNERGRQRVALVAAAEVAAAAIPDTAESRHRVPAEDVVYEGVRHRVPLLFVVRFESLR